MNYILNFLAPLLGTAMLLQFLRALLDNSLGGWRVPVTALLLNLITIPRMLLPLGAVPTMLAVLAGVVAVVFVVPLVFFRGKWWMRILLSLYLWTLLMLCDLLASSYFIPRLGENILNWSTGNTLIYMAASLLLFLLLGSLSVLVIRQFQARQFQPAYALFLLYPLSLWMLAYAYIFQNLRWLWLPGVLLSMAAQFALLANTLAQERLAEQEQELRNLRHTMELERNYYQMVDEKREELARIRHDFNNQLAAIGQLFRTGAEDDAQKMIAHLSKDIHQTRENVYCGVPVVNAVLEEKARMCRSRGIALETSLELPQPCSLDPLHLCSAFSNLMDNAIRGAEISGTPHPWVQLHTMVDGDYIFIRTQNPAAAPLKQPQPGRGYGSKILGCLADQHGGTYRTDFQDGLYTAVLTLGTQGTSQ